MAKNNNKIGYQTFLEKIYFQLLLGEKKNLGEYLQNMAYAKRESSKNNNYSVTKVLNLTLEYLGIYGMYVKSYSLHPKLLKCFIMEISYKFFHLSHFPFCIGNGQTSYQTRCTIVTHLPIRVTYKETVMLCKLLSAMLHHSN